MLSSGNRIKSVIFLLCYPTTYGYDNFLEPANLREEVPWDDTEVFVDVVVGIV